MASNSVSGGFSDVFDGIIGLRVSSPDIMARQSRASQVICREGYMGKAKVDVSTCMNDAFLKH